MRGVVVREFRNRFALGIEKFRGVEFRVDNRSPWKAPIPNRNKIESLRQGSGINPIFFCETKPRLNNSNALARTAPHARVVAKASHIQRDARVNILVSTGINIVLDQKLVDESILTRKLGWLRSNRLERPL